MTAPESPAVPPARSPESVPAEPTGPAEPTEPTGPAGLTEGNRLLYEQAVAMAIYEGTNSGQLMAIFTQFGILIVAGAVFPSFTGSDDPRVRAIFGCLISVAGLIMAGMFSSMTMRIRTYEEYWSARSAELETSLQIDGIFAGASRLSRTGRIVVGGSTIRMRRLYGVRTKYLLLTFYGLFALVYLMLLVFNLVHLAEAA